MPSSFEKTDFGVVDGEKVFQYVIKNSYGLSMTCTNFGATILSVLAPDRNGNLEEVTLCHHSLEELQRVEGRPYFGCVAGRVANRIAKGQFQINDHVYNVAVNNGVNHLHGGLKGFDQKVWSAVQVSREDRIGVEFQYISPDGEENYPGNLMVSVVYYLTDMNDLVIDYTAFTDKDTIVNLTNHTYWNLSGSLKSKVYDHHLQLSSSYYLPVDATQIPTGALEPVENSAFDFTKEKKLIESIMAVDGGGRAGLDHCFVVDGAVEQVEQAEGTRLDYLYDSVEQLQGLKSYLRYVATLTDPASGRQLILHATQPGVQVYTGNWLSQTTSDHPYTQHNAICLETQHFPDSINKPHFPPVLFTKGDCPYYHIAVFSFRIR